MKETDDTLPIDEIETIENIQETITESELKREVHLINAYGLNKDDEPIEDLIETLTIEDLREAREKARKRCLHAGNFALYEPVLARFLYENHYHDEDN